MKRILESKIIDKDETENPRVKAAIYLSCVAGVCTLLVLILVSIIVVFTSCLWFKNNGYLKINVNY